MRSKRLITLLQSGQINWSTHVRGGDPEQWLLLHVTFGHHNCVILDMGLSGYQVFKYDESAGRETVAAEIARLSA